MNDKRPEISMFYTLFVHDHQVAVTLNSDAIESLRDGLESFYQVPADLMRIDRCWLPSVFAVAPYIVPKRFTIEQYHNGEAAAMPGPTHFGTHICGNYRSMENHALEIIRDRVGLDI